MKHPSRPELAEQLKKKRAKLGWGVRQTAKEVGVSPATYSRMENAKPMTVETYFLAIDWVEKK